MLSTFVSRYGYTDVSAYRGWMDFASFTGNSDGMLIGKSALREASGSNADGSRFGGGNSSWILFEYQQAAVLDECDLEFSLLK
jgi:hypothetical protein